MYKFHLDTLYKVNSNIIVFNENEKIILYNISENWKSSISKLMYEYIYAFFVARTIESAVIEINKRYFIKKEDCESIINDLIKKNIIVIYEQTGIKTINGIGGMFNTPLMSLNEVLSSNYVKVVYLGFPYDLSVTNKSGCRLATSYIRSESTALFQYETKNSKAIGQWNCVEDRYILSDVTMADCGDISNVVFERNGREFDYLREIISIIIKQNKLPIVIGGDHSISLPAIWGAADALGDIGVIHFDAHTDFSGRQKNDWRKGCHHGNFMNWVVNDQRVKTVAQFGIRQLTDNKITDEKIKVWPGIKAKHQWKNVLDNLPNDIPYYLTLDVDCLEPYIISSTGTPLPGGFTYYDLLELLKKICSSFNIIGFDIVELIPGTNNEGIIVSGIILNMIDYIMNSLK